MDFIREIQEARMTRTESNTKKLSYRDCCERAYLCLLILELLRQFPNYNNLAQKYAKNTARHTNYDYFRSNSTDLYNFIYFIVGDEKALEKLKDPEDAARIRERTHLPTMAVNRYLTKVGGGQTPSSVPQFFMSLESKIPIGSNDYKNIRRVITNIKGQDNKRDVYRAVTKLLYAARARLRSGDLIDDLEKFAADRNLEWPRTRDTQPAISRSDAEISNTELLFLQRIVGKNKLPLALKYIELQQQGKPIPSNVAQAFLPAIDLLVDIIKGGGSYVQQLQRLQKLANRQRRRR